MTDYITLLGVIGIFVVIFYRISFLTIYSSG